MIIALFIISVAVLAWGLWEINAMRAEGAGWTMATCGIIGAVGSFIALIVISISVSNLRTVAARIDMYQEENAKIEAQVAELVEQYQDYETDIFTDTAPDSAITLVTMYPELKSDALVAKQIEMYLSNNEKIKELRLEQISGSVYKWWLYFGG